MSVFDIIKERAKNVLAELGEMEGGKVTVKMGRFGMYMNWKKVNAKVPSEYFDDPSQIPLEVAWEHLEKKASAAPRVSKKKSKDSSVKLPPAPKRPPSAYFHFCAEKRPEVSSRFKSLGEVSKELGRLWKELSSDERASYDVLAMESKKKYEDAKKEWMKDCQKVLSETKGKSKAVKVIKTKGGVAKTRN